MMLDEKIGAVMVVGGGIAGVQASLDLANSGYHVYLVERTGAVGGTMAQIDKTFPGNECAMCILSPKLVECGRHLNIQLLTLTDVLKVEGDMGRFQVTLRQRPRYVDMDKCIACGQCAEVCPKTVPDEHTQGLGRRKAIHVKYPQAVPLKYEIDPTSCIRLNKGRCSACEKACAAGAIRFHDTERIQTILVGSIILAPGFRTFDPTGIRTWGYGLFPNVITSMELEQYFSVVGPTEGRLIRPSDGSEVKKIAFLQCVGSRDYNKASHGYCSAVCCMYGIKEALLALDHVKDLDASIFYIDSRTHGKDFERYYERAVERGIHFHRCRVHSLEPGETGGIAFRYVTDDGRQVKREFDLVVLSVGMEMGSEACELASRVGIELNENRFASVSSFAPVSTTRPGVYVCGAFSGPKDIPQSVIEASAAATSAAIPLIDARYSMYRHKEFPVERDVTAEELCIGVFVCHCGSNIAGVIDVEALADYAETLPHVRYVERAIFACSQDTQETIKQRIEQYGLNRIVVAACTPRTHEAAFRETLRSVGLNEYLIEMVNIRNQAAWVHSLEPASATDKAKDLLRMGVAKAALLEPLPPVSVNVNPQALVIGGGVSGMVVALGLAEQGFPVHVVEKSSQLGGNALHLGRTWKNEPIPAFVQSLISQVREHPLITVHLKSTVSRAEGFLGNFRTWIQQPSSATVIDHGVAIFTTGGQGYKPDEYGYGRSQRVLTALEFDKLHLVGDERVRYGSNFVFIQCVGSREPSRPYCSRVCCTHSIQAAIALKEEDPTRNIFILYRDVRTYGQREELYKRARELGVVFVRYELEQKPKVLLDDDSATVVVWDHVLHEPFNMAADVVVLATSIVPSPETRELAKLYRLPVDADGFLQEAHMKLRPVDFVTDGLFLAGLAHYPKPIEEAVAQAQAAVARAVTVLSKRRIDLDSIKAIVDYEKCDGCALCLDVCPYHAINTEEAGGKVRITIAAPRCKGCGVCQATCPKDGVNIGGFSYKQITAQVEAALRSDGTCSR